jgi:DHA1 family multidrug resistance protein-like MFS transporter
MFVDMDIQWACTLLGCVAVVLVPVPVLFHYYGPKLRQKSKWAPTMSVAPSQAQELEKQTGA